MSKLTKGYLIAALSIVIWSSTGIFLSYLMTVDQMPAMLLVFWRNFLVCVALLPALALIRPALLHLERTQIKFHIFYGLILAVFNAIWTLSIRANGAAVATVVAYSAAGFTALLAWWLFKEPLGPGKIGAIILSLTGCILVANAYDPGMWTANPLGVATGLLSGLLFAAYNLMGKAATTRGVNAWTSILYSFAFAAVFTFLFNLLPILPGAAGSLGAMIPQLPPQGWLALITLSFGPTVLGFGLYNTSMNYLPASTLSLLATTEPAMTAVQAYILLGETMSLIQIIGGLLIITAVVLAVRFDKAETNDLAFEPT